MSPEKSLFARHFDVSDMAEGQNLAYEDTFEIVEQGSVKSAVKTRGFFSL